MSLINIYQLGRSLNLGISFGEYERRVKFVFFPYKAKEIISTAILVLIIGVVISLVLGAFSTFIRSTLIFMSILAGAIAFIYPYQVYYTQKIMEYREEMLRSILHLSTFIQTGSSIEYSFANTENSLSGILKYQFGEINSMLERRAKNNLGDAIKVFIEDWKRFNPQYVKAIRLLQIAALSEEDEREKLIRETLETLTMNYMTLGKRSAEELSKKTNMIIGAGLLLPIMSLLGLPILAIFMPHLVREPVVAFIYVVLFPSIVFVASLSFASKRVQVDTIRIKDSEKYRPFPRFYFYLGIIIVIIASIPTAMTINFILGNPAEDVSTLRYLFFGWSLSAGIALAVYIYSYFYVKRYEKLWEEIDSVEKDLPFMLQSFSTYFTLNTPMEKVIDGMVDDYKNLGFTKHPVVRAFQTIKRKLYTSKDTIHAIIKKQITKVIPSSKVRNILLQISNYEEVSQESAAKASKLIREQVINTYKLDDYIKTLLSETTGLIKSGASLLAPLLSAAAVIMTFAILKSIVYITEQLGKISQIFGGQAIELSLIDVTNVVSPIFIEAIIGVYLVEMLIILSVFQTQISSGSDTYLIMKNLKSNILSFVLYTLILFIGFYFINMALFPTLTGGG